MLSESYRTVHTLTVTGENMRVFRGAMPVASRDFGSAILVDLVFLSCLRLVSWFRNLILVFRSSRKVVGFQKDGPIDGDRKASVSASKHDQTNNEFGRRPQSTGERVVLLSSGR